MGPDHSQLEIYRESKHGVLFDMQQDTMNLNADPKTLSTEDMSVPTCSTCHMSGLEGMDVTHDVGERLSWYLFSPVSEKRKNYERGQQEMKEVCSKCHAESHTDTFFEQAETVVETTNKKVRHAEQMMDKLYEQGHLTEEPFDEKIEFVYFDLWHYYGRTAKHGAFMGGADFVQWHGNYELLHKQVKLDELAEKYHGKSGKKSGEADGADDGEGDGASSSGGE
jgi:cytochrome c5